VEAASKDEMPMQEGRKSGDIVEMALLYVGVPSITL
jgi:hypothetical protein